MSQRVVIWAATRTSSTNLCHALHAENEPFQAGPPPSRLAWAYKAWQTSGETYPLVELCASETDFKHVPEWFDDGFNVALAQIATDYGYRHIHLVRMNSLARLISLDVAGQLNAWWPEDAEARFAELARGDRTLNPLDVPRLIAVCRQAMRCWLAIRPYLGPMITVTQEFITSRDQGTRHTALREVMRFLELPEDALPGLDAAMRDGGQHGERMRALLPNVDELRTALIAEGM